MRYILVLQSCCLLFSTYTPLLTVGNYLLLFYLPGLVLHPLAHLHYLRLMSLLIVTLVLAVCLQFQIPFRLFLSSHFVIRYLHIQDTYPFRMGLGKSQVGFRLAHFYLLL